MALFTPADCRAYLEGYVAISTAGLSDSWIQGEIDDTVIPYAENYMRTSLSGKKQVTEIYSGNGTSVLILNRKNIISIDAISLVRDVNYISNISPAAVEVLAGEGILKAKTNYNEGIYCTLWPKGNDNIRIQYTFGNLTCPNDIIKALIKLTCVLMLDNIEGRTGGGDLATEGHSRGYGRMGKYTYARIRMANQAHATLKRFSSSVVGA